MNADPFQAIRDFEKAVGEYTGAPHVVAVDSCTNAIFLVLKYIRITSFSPNLPSPTVEIPKRTYLSIASQILHADFKLKFRDEEWVGQYQLKPLPVWDAARRFTSGMFKDIDKGTTTMTMFGHKWVHRNGFQCVSFGRGKILSMLTGGAILHNNDLFDDWARRARFDGRREKVHPKDDDLILGYRMRMLPQTATEGLHRLLAISEHNADLPTDDYPDLSKKEIFK
jgi:dTDP-4-amino-4,6-dideoxygalactose transaminase